MYLTRLLLRFGIYSVFVLVYRSSHSLPFGGKHIGCIPPAEGLKGPKASQIPERGQMVPYSPADERIIDLPEQGMEFIR